MSLLISWAAFTAESGLPDLYCRFNVDAWGTPVAVTGKAWHLPDYRDNQGKVGDHPSQFMMRLPACLTSTTADLWMLLSRTNDSTTNSMTLTDSKPT